MADREDMIRMCPVPGANCTTSKGIFSLAILLLHTFIGNLFRLVCLYLEMPLVATMLRFVVWAVRGSKSTSSSSFASSSLGEVPSQSDATSRPCCIRVSVPATVPAAYPPSPFVMSHSREMVSLRSQHMLRSNSMGTVHPPGVSRLMRLSYERIVFRSSPLSLLLV